MSRTEMPAPICWTVKRNCSASPAQLAAVFASIVGLSFIFGIAFATQGLWLILPFVGLELVAVAIAFFCYGRRAADYERITLSEGDLSIERVEGARATRWHFPARGRPSSSRRQATAGCAASVSSSLRALSGSK
jgi:uncharacterized membrane protein